MSRRLRVLCLHGNQQCAQLFENKTERLRRACSDVATFHYAEGPEEREQQPGDDLPPRGWFPAEDPGFTADAPPSGRWVDCLGEVLGTHGPFDAVLGFSEGAIAAAVLCACQQENLPLGEQQVHSLRGMMVFGAPDVPGIPEIDLPSLHFGSGKDNIVPLELSQQLAGRFTNAKLVEHANGHCVPTKPDLEAEMHSFLKGLRGLPEVEVEGAALEEHTDELECLKDMYGGGEAQIISTSPARLRIRLVDLTSAFFVLPPRYPEECPPVVLVETSDWRVSPFEADLKRAMMEAVDEGSPSIWQMTTAGQEWLEGHLANYTGANAPGQQVQQEEEEEEEEVVIPWWDKDDIDMEAMRAATEEAAAAGPPPASRDSGSQSYLKPWTYTVGLVGKPSAGKSTFFNSVARYREGKMAEMSERPFTTIDPNIDTAYFAAPSPHEEWGIADCQPELGFIAGGRRATVMLKDVAGLVPGAHSGNGKGNFFLSCLCDADALIHVIDASGQTTEEGALGEGDPVRDIQWVREELHLWIFGNIRRKWDSVRRKAKAQRVTQEAVLERLADLLVGYHTTRSTIFTVLERAGFSVAKIVAGREGIATWGEAEVHRLVAHFLHARFPIVLAMNKADGVKSKANIERVREAYPHDVVVPVCARAEWWLKEYTRQKQIKYEEGTDQVTALETASDQVRERAAVLSTKVLGAFGSTGVLRALTQAVEMRQPVFCFPVEDTGTCASVIHGKTAGPPLATMVMLRPMATLGDAFEALKHDRYLAGQLVRGEVKGINRAIRKDEILPSVCVVKIMSNRKSNYQRKPGHQPGDVESGSEGEEENGAE